MTEFNDLELRGSRFDRVDMTGALFREVDLSDVQFRVCEFSRVTMHGVDLIDVEIHGQVENLVINDVDVTPLIEAELDRRHPERIKMRPVDPDGFREAWRTLDRLWEGTIERARSLRPEQVHERVNGEWSFIETLRHLSYATDCWVNRAIIGDSSPWDPLDLPHDEATDGPEFSPDRNAAPTLETVLELRRSRSDVVREFIEQLTEDALNSENTVEGPGWPPPGDYLVRTCLRIVLNEEWQHRLYAERDLDVIMAHSVRS